MNLRDLGGHDGKVFDAWVVRKAIGVPDDDIVVDNIITLALVLIVVVEERLDAVPAQALVGVVTCWEELAVLVFGHPEWMLREFATPPVPGAWPSKQHL